MNSKKEEKSWREPKTFDAYDWVWFVVRAKQEKAFCVADELSDKGFMGFAPASDRFFVRQNRKIWRQYPVFGEYVFVGSREGCCLFKRSSSLINEVLNNGTSPVPVPAAAIATLSEMDHLGLWSLKSARGAVSPQWKQGDYVRILEGPYAKMEGIVKGTRGKLKLILEIGLYDVVIGTRQVEKIKL